MAMLPPDTTLILAATAVPAIGLVSGAGLRAWNQWLDVRRLGIETGARADTPDKRDLASLRERVKQLEAIASGS